MLILGQPASAKSNRRDSAGAAGRQRDAMNTHKLCHSVFTSVQSLPASAPPQETVSLVVQHLLGINSVFKSLCGIYRFLCKLSFCVSLLNISKSSGRTEVLNVPIREVRRGTSAWEQALVTNYKVSRNEGSVIISLLAAASSLLLTQVCFLSDPILSPERVEGWSQGRPALRGHPSLEMGPVAPSNCITSGISTGTDSVSSENNKGDGCACVDGLYGSNKTGALTQVVETKRTDHKTRCFPSLSSSSLCLLIECDVLWEWGSLLPSSSTMDL